MTIAYLSRHTLKNVLCREIKYNKCIHQQHDLPGVYTGLMYKLVHTTVRYLYSIHELYNL